MSRTARPTAAGDDRVGVPLTIVVGYDFSDAADLALEEAITLGGNSPPAAIHVLGVLGRGGHGIGAPRPLHHVRFDEAEEMQQRISQAVEATLDRLGQAGLRVLVHCRIAQPARAIIALASEVHADLIVVGTHSRVGVERILVGSIAEQVMRRAACPVLVMRRSSYDRDVAEETAEELQPEPPCPACVARRKETGGASWWCAAHDHAWVPPRRYAYTDEGISRMRPNEWVLW